MSWTASKGGSPIGLGVLGPEPSRPHGHLRTISGWPHPNRNRTTGRMVSGWRVIRRGKSHHRREADLPLLIRIGSLRTPRLKPEPRSAATPLNSKSNQNNPSCLSCATPVPRVSGGISVGSTNRWSHRTARAGSPGPTTRVRRRREPSPVWREGVRRSGRTGRKQH